MATYYTDKITEKRNHKNLDNKLKDKKKDLFFLMIITVIALFALWHSQYGFPSSDEFLHLSLPYRMWQGDALIAEEWHQTQLSAFTYYPITHLIITLNNGTDGLVIWSRFACIALEFCTALIVYYRMKRFSWIGATLSSVIFMLYTPNAFTSMFYYTIGIMSMTVAFLFIATSDGKYRTDYFISGIFMALAVLNIPHAVFMYFIYAVAVIVMCYRNRKWKKEDWRGNEYFSAELFAYFTAGIALVTVIFILYLILNVPFEKLVQSISPIMTDQNHAITFGFKLIVYFGCIFLYNSKIVGVVMLLLFLEMIFRRKYKDSTYFMLATVMTILLEIYYFISHDFPHGSFVSYMMFAPNCLALFCAVLSNRKKVKKLFATMYIPGIIYTFFFNLSSNQGFAALSSSIAVSTVASVVIIVLYAYELISNIPDIRISVKRMCTAVICLFVVFQLSAQLYVRMACLYGTEDIRTRTVRLEDGVMKGVITNSSKANDYEEYKKQIEISEETYNYDTVLTATMRTWLCVMYGCEISNYSSYINNVDEEFMEKQALYFEINPEKMPDLVYTQHGNEEFVDWFLSKYTGYNTDEYDFGYILYKEGCKK